MNERIEALRSIVGQNVAVDVQNDNERWYDVSEGKVYRVLTEGERIEEALEEIHECWSEWRYRLEELIESTGLSEEVLGPYVEDGWIWTLPQFVIDHIHQKVGEKKFEQYLLDKYLKEKNVGLLLDKENNEEKIVGDYYIYQWC